jgi:hypothetical protein
VTKRVVGGVFVRSLRRFIYIYQVICFVLMIIKLLRAMLLDLEAILNQIYALNLCGLGFLLA